MSMAKPLVGSTQPVIDTEKEQHTPKSSAEKQPEDESPQQLRKQRAWCGKFELGKWYCNCPNEMREANCITVTKDGPNKNRRFWRCPGDRRTQCPFFVWVDEEPEVRAWLRKVNPEIYLGTPRKQGWKPGDPLTPGTESSRKPTGLEEWLGLSEKKRSFHEVSGDEEEEGDLYGADDGENFTAQDNTRNSSPSRKSAKITRFDIPGQPFYKRLEACKAPLPTPNTRGRDVEEVLEPRRPQPMEAWETSPTPVQFGDAVKLGAENQPRHKKSDLSRTIIALLRADYPGLKGSTEIMIQHEIEQEVGRHQADVKQFERTISRFKNRLEVLQRQNDFLVTGAAVDDVVDLSQ